MTLRVIIPLSEMSMKKFLILYEAPPSVIDEWKKTPEAERKPAEEKMMNEWKQWMASHSKLFADKGAGVGRTKRVAAEGASDTRNDIMLYQVAEAESHEAAAQQFIGHPHLQIPQASIEVMEIQPMPA